MNSLNIHYFKNRIVLLCCRILSTLLIEIRNDPNKIILSVIYRVFNSGSGILASSAVLFYKLMISDLLQNLRLILLSHNQAPDDGNFELSG